MDTNVVVAYLAIGGMTKLVTLQYPTPGQRWATALTIVLGGCLAGWLALYLPAEQRYLSVAFLALPFLGDVIGVWIGRLIDRIRLGLEKVEDERAAETEWTQGRQSERIGGLGTGKGESDAD